jgi:hypothetical protein
MEPRSLFIAYEHRTEIFGANRFSRFTDIGVAGRASEVLLLRAIGVARALDTDVGNRGADGRLLGTIFIDDALPTDTQLEYAQRLVPGAMTVFEALDAHALGITVRHGLATVGVVEALGDAAMVLADEIRVAVPGFETLDAVPTVEVAVGRPGPTVVVPRAIPLGRRFGRGDRCVRER